MMASSAYKVSVNLSPRKKLNLAALPTLQEMHRQPFSVVK